MVIHSMSFILLKRGRKIKSKTKREKAVVVHNKTLHEPFFDITTPMFVIKVSFEGARPGGTVGRRHFGAGDLLGDPRVTTTTTKPRITKLMGT